MKKSPAAASLIATLAASTALGSGTITSGNASLQFVGIPVFSSTLGDGTFKTDATASDQLYKFTWYYRTATATTNRVMSALDTPTESYVGDTATFTYVNAGPGVAGQERFDATVITQLADGAAPNQSRVTGTCRVKSRATAARRYDFFVIVDLDLAGGTPNAATDDTLALNTQTFNMLQTESSSSNVANVQALTPTRWQVGAGSTLRTLLSGPTADLNNSAGPYTGDGAVAFQWTLQLQPGEERVLSLAFAINDSAFCQAPTLTQNPANAAGCAADVRHFIATGVNASSQLWEVESPAGSGSFATISAPTFTEASTGLSFIISGATTSDLAVSGVQLGSHPPRLTFRSRLANACGSATSNAATYAVDPCSPACPADFNQDGGVDGADVDAFFSAWETGDSIADVNADGGVDGTDVSAFFIAWEAGGC
jgi:hypothetical protein